MHPFLSWAKAHGHCVQEGRYMRYALWSRIGDKLWAEWQSGIVYY